MFIGVKAFHGEDGGLIRYYIFYMLGGELTDDVDVAICTIERANIILNQVLEEKNIPEEDLNRNRICMIVVDELHLVSDPKRGYLLEVLLAKVY